MDDLPLPRIVLVATSLSLLPLLIGLLLVIAPGVAPLSPLIVERAIIGYAALLLAFLGGVRWGIRAGSGTGTDRTYLLGALGALIGLITLVLPFQPAIACLTVGFAGQGAWDVWAGYRGTIPDSYARRRMSATLMVCAVLVAIFAVNAA